MVKFIANKSCMNIKGNNVRALTWLHDMAFCKVVYLIILLFDLNSFFY